MNNNINIIIIIINNNNNINIIIIIINNNNNIIAIHRFGSTAMPLCSFK